MCFSLVLLLMLLSLCMQHENRKRAEDALVREAQRTGRFVDLAVHSFQASMPPSRLVVPEGVSVDFLRRQIQYRVEVAPQSLHSLLRTNTYCRLLSS